MRIQDPVAQLRLWPDYEDTPWWQSLSIWQIRQWVSSVERPVEDEALDNIYYETRALISGAYRRALSKLERDVYNLDKYAKRNLPHYYRDVERYQWIAERLRGRVSGARDVQFILADVSFVIRSLGYAEIAIERLRRRREIGQMIVEKAA